MALTIEAVRAGVPEGVRVDEMQARPNRIWRVFFTDWDGRRASLEVSAEIPAEDALANLLPAIVTWAERNRAADAAAAS